MALNTNHTVEDLNDIKCAIVEKNVSKERAAFLRTILEGNNFTVIVVPSPPPKAAKTVAPTTDAPVADSDAPAAEATSATFTVGVTDVRFNSVNAIFGRLLRSPEGHFVTLAYWNQEEKVSNDEIPYYENG